MSIGAKESQSLNNRSIMIHYPFTRTSSHDALVERGGTKVAALHKRAKKELKSEKV